MDLPLLGTMITGNQIQSWLGKYYSGESPLKIASCRAEKIGENQGFTSTIARVTLEYDERESGAVNKSNQSPPKSVVFKTISPKAMQDLMQKMGYESELSTESVLPLLGYFHRNETALYKVLAKNTSPVPIPRIYKITDFHSADNAGAILMEDLSRGGGTDCPIVDGPLDTVSMEKLYHLADALAGLHAWCWKNTEKWSDTIQPANDNITSSYVDSMKRSFLKLDAKYRIAFAQLDVDEAAQYLKAMHKSDVAKQQREIYPNVIVHGDFYAPNFIFEPAASVANNRDKDETSTNGLRREGTTMKLSGIVDWGLCHGGCGMEDFARLLTLSVDTSLRRERTIDILKRYYDTLVKKVGGAENLKASFDDILRVYDRQFVIAALVFVLLLKSLMNLYVNENEQNPDHQRKVLFDRCVGVYEDFLPLWNEIRQSTTKAATDSAGQREH